MRIVFMGTPDFAVPSLNRVAELHEVVAVYSRPDAVSGRGGSRLPSPVSVSATALGLDVRTPVSLRDPSELESLRALAPDALIVAAYGLILPGEVLGAARLGGINVHGSLLPRWRGAAPVQRAILAGDQVTGVSIMQMEVGLDTGPYCAVTEVQIDGKDAATLTAELAEVGARLLVEALPRIDDGTAIWTVQDEALATYAEKISKADVAPSPELSVDSNLRRVRASTPAAPSRITLAGRGVTLLECRESEVVVTQGGILSTKSALVLGSADGSFEAVTVKPDGKGAMDGAAYGRGLRIDPTDEWGYAR